MPTNSYLRLYPLHSNVPGWPANLPAVFEDDCPEISDVLPADIWLHDDSGDTQDKGKREEDISSGRPEPIS